MRTRRIGWRGGLVGGGLVLALAAATLAVTPSVLDPFFRREHPLAGLHTATVRRTDLSGSMTASGRVDSSERTVIECELENLDVRVKGMGMTAGGASTILSVIPDGSSVRQGDVLCVLDASGYEDLLDTQTMNVDRARADFRTAELNLDVARMAVGEYRDGLMLQALKTMEGSIALSRSDRERVAARLVWTRRMLAKGYLPRSQVTAEEFQSKQLEVALTNAQATLRLFKRFSAPIYLRILESDVRTAEAAVGYQQSRLRQNEARLARLRRQVERCTIRAPHAGFVIYANEEMKSVRIEPGLAVRQRQRLFYLPDLSRMEVAAMLHESVVREVKPGMLARVRLEGMSDRLLEGHVVSIAMLPTQNLFTQVNYFVGVVKLDHVPKGVRPGMSAEIEIRTVRRPDVLAVPVDALAVEQGQDVCYVAREEQVERREVKIGQSTRDLLEVTEGLDEGEEVVLDPTHRGAGVWVAATGEGREPVASESAGAQ